MEIEILEFQVPAENNKMLLVWDIEPGRSKAQVYEKLYSIFSCFGPLYLLKVCSNAPQNPPGYYAVIRFYSALQASKAQYHTDGQALFQTSPLKVRLGSRHMQHCPLSVKRRSLSHSHCVELANHFLGFNGWRTDIIALEQLSHENEAAEGGEPFRRLKFGCQLELCFPHHRQSIKAAAVVEDSFTCTEAFMGAGTKGTKGFLVPVLVVDQRPGEQAGSTGPEPETLREPVNPCVLGEFGSAPRDLWALPRCKLQRLVRERALVQAFSRVLLILIGEDKVMLEVKHTPDQLPAVLTEEVVQVSELTPDGSEDDDVRRLALS